MIDADRIFESLDNAVANGYDLRDGWTALEIADDMANYDAYAESIPLSALIPIVQMWLDKGPK